MVMAATREAKNEGWVVSLQKQLYVDQIYSSFPVLTWRWFDQAHRRQIIDARRVTCGGAWHGPSISSLLILPARRQAEAHVGPIRAAHLTIKPSTRPSFIARSLLPRLHPRHVVTQ